MKPKLIIHIGHPKTGSTSIQKTLSAARLWLNDRHVLYPETTIISHNHRVLRASMFGVPVNKNLNIRLGQDDYLANDASILEFTSVLRQIVERKPETIILSSEGFFGSLLDGDAARFQKSVQQITDQPVRVLGYVRSPPSYYLSKAQQRLKGGWGLTMPKNFRRLDAIQAYIKSTGISVEVRTFERSMLLKGDVVADFAEWIGYPELATEFAIAEENTSVSAEAMSVLHRLVPNRTIVDAASLKAHRRLVKAVKELDSNIPEPTKPVLREAIAAHVTKLNVDLLELRDQYGLSFDDIDYSLVGQDPFMIEPNIQSVDDICKLDTNRRDDLEVAVLKTLSEESRLQSWVGRLFRTTKTFR